MRAPADVNRHNQQSVSQALAMFRQEAALYNRALKDHVVISGCVRYVLSKHGGMVCHSEEYSGATARGRPCAQLHRGRGVAGPSLSAHERCCDLFVRPAV